MRMRPKHIIFAPQFEIADIWKDEAGVSALNRRCIVTKMEDHDTHVESTTADALQIKLNDCNA